MDIENELDKIAEEFIYTIDYIIWQAFLPNFYVNNLDDETYLQYAKDAAKSVRFLQHKAPDDKKIKILVSEYEALLKKYGYADDIIKPAAHLMFKYFLIDWMMLIHEQSVDEGGPEEVPELPAGDIDNHTMAWIFANLPSQPEVADYLAKIDINYACEHFHMVTWFSDQMTHGIRYGFERKHNFSSRKTYNHLMNPCSLLWIAAALGEDLNVVKKASVETKTAKTDAEKSKIIRKSVPFDRIYELALRMKAEEEDDDI